MTTTSPALYANGHRTRNKDALEHSHNTTCDSLTVKSYSTDDDYECPTPNSSLTDDMDAAKPQQNGIKPANGVPHSEKPGHHRRHSTPLMPSFMVSAPGKVIVFGEHAVVHGKVSVS